MTAEALPLAVSGVSARYGVVTAIQDVTIELRPGEILTIIGANGAGKSTLIKAICGLIVPYAGEVRVYGDPVTGRTPDAIVARGLTVVPEGRRLFKNMTLLENLEMGAYSQTDSRQIRDDLDRILDLFPEMRDRLSTRAGTFSGGQQQMIAVARALMSRPRTLLLDEPTIGLAPAIVERIGDIITRISKTGVNVLLVEQNAETALAIADRAYILESGRIVAEDTAENTARSPEVQRAYLGV